MHTATLEIENKKSILVIDDCIDALYLGKMLLERVGFKVFTASSGKEAFRILNEINEPNLVLLDMQMDDMSGKLFLEILQERKPNFMTNVPVVFYSAADKIPSSKASGFIRKAGDIDHFLEQVHSYINLH